MAHWAVITNIILNEKSKRQKCIYFIISTMLRTYTYRDSKENLPKPLLWMVRFMGDFPHPYFFNTKFVSFNKN